MTPARGALFLFAHQDDEYAAAPWILEELARGPVACLFLTDGATNASAAVRDAESVAVLESLGVSPGAIVFLTAGAASLRIADGGLAGRASEALDAVRGWIANARFAPSRIYAPSYEGGHPDHDAAHLVAAALATQLGIAHDAWQFSLYNGFRCPAPFFSSLRQLPTAQPSRAASLPFARRIQLAMLCWRYPSQRRTWLGLFPGALFERALGRERVVQFDLNRFDGRPHDGTLLYERLFGIPYERFATQTAALRDTVRAATQQKAT